MAGLGSWSHLQTSDLRQRPRAHPLSVQREKPTPGQNEATATIEAAPEQKGASDRGGRRAAFCLMIALKKAVSFVGNS